MLRLELFVVPDCPCRESALETAKKAVETVRCVELVLRSDPGDQARAKSLGVVVSPTFVLEGEICAVGKPSLEFLVGQIKDRLS